MKTKKYLTIASTSMLIAIILGAMGAHYLKETLELPTEKLESWKTAVFYQIIHSLSILIIAVLATTIKIDKIGIVVNLFLIGMLCFSGSIYFLSLNYIWKIEALKFLGPITPIGGMLFIAGWIVLIFKLKGIKSN